MSVRRPNLQSDHGVALIAVLWTVAILAVMVTALMAQVKTDIQYAALSRAVVLGEAEGRAAIVLVLQDIKITGAIPNRFATYSVDFKGRKMDVAVTPLNGYVDLNRAPEGMLIDLLRVIGNLQAAKAAELSGAILERRRQSQSQQAGGVAFEAVEDLLQLPGFTYEIFRSIRGAVTVYAQGSGRVNPLAAPKEVLVILAGGNVAVANEFEVARASKRTDAELDTTKFNAEYIEKSGSMRLRLDVYFLESDQRPVATHFVDLRGDRRMGQAWRILS